MSSFSYFIYFKFYYFVVYSCSITYFFRSNSDSKLIILSFCYLIFVIIYPYLYSEVDLDILNISYNF